MFFVSYRFILVDVEEVLIYVQFRWKIILENSLGKDF